MGGGAWCAGPRRARGRSWRWITLCRYRAGVGMRFRTCGLCAGSATGGRGRRCRMCRQRVAGVGGGRREVREGGHGELDWRQTLEVLSRLVKGLLERGTDLALVDLRDARHELTDKQRAALADLLGQVGVRAHHRIAILFAPTAHPRPPVFVEAARKLGFDVGRFYSYEEAAEWLSRSGEPD